MPPASPVADPFSLSAALPFADDAVNQNLLVGLLAAFTVIWIGALGAAIGSFLNVVVYRMPRGLSLNRPKSRCPACETPIRRTDNVPVLGWLRLRGRCRACGAPISPRYPLVEAATAGLFLGLARVELLSGGGNIPERPINAYGGALFTIWYTRWDLVGLYAYHLALLCLLLCVALIVWDGLAPPRRLVVAGLVLGLVPPALMPTLYPVAAGGPTLPEWTTQLALGGRVGFAPGALLTGLAGAATGIVVGRLLAFAAPQGPEAEHDRRGASVAAMFVGAFLGWQASASHALFAAVLVLVSSVVSRTGRRRLPVTVAVAAAALLQVVFWRATGRVDWWPDHTGWDVLRRIGWPEPLFALTSLAAAAVAAGSIARLARITLKNEPPQQIEPAEPVRAADGT